MKNTPAPWVVRAIHNRSIRYEIRAESGCVADVWGDLPNDGIGKEEAAANSALIAAAPELLGVLRDCLSYMDAMAVIRGGEALELRDKCRSAIAQAEGRA